MDRVKKLKVKKSDGTFTDYIPVGADAIYVDLSDGDNAENAIARIKSGYAHYYDNIASMKNDTKLKEGDIAVTLGYYEINDGGNGTYKIKNDATLVDDGGSIHNLNNGLKAELIIENKTINLAQMGLSTTNAKDINTSIIYNTIYLLRNGGTVIIPMGVYNINPIIIDFSTRYLTIKGINKDSILQQVTSNDYAIRFTESQGNITLEDIYIENNSVGSGIAFESTTNSGSVHLLRTFIRNCIHGYKLHNVVYLYANEANAGMSGNRCTSESFAYEIQGYEYNRMENCAAQINGNVSTYIKFPMCKIIDTPYIWIKNCEFVKTGGPGVYIASKNSNFNTNHIYLEDLELYRVGEGIRIVPDETGISNININNCHVTLLGGTMGSNLEDESAISILHEDTTKTSKCQINCDNLSVFKAPGSSSPHYLIYLEDDILESGSFTRISNRYNNQANFHFGNNVLSNLTLTSPKMKGTISIVSDGTKKSYNCIKNAAETPVVRNCVPKVVMTPNKENRSDLFNYDFIAHKEWYEDDTSRFRWTLTFLDAVPPAGTYKFDYQILF